MPERVRRGENGAAAAILHNLATRHGEGGGVSRVPQGLRLLAAAAALAALAALALAWSVQPLVHDDLFWHLRTGAWIAAHGRVPLTDLFSYTCLGARWITHEWGFSWLSHLIWRAAGAAGLVAAGAALTLGIFGAVAWRAWLLVRDAVRAAPPSSLILSPPAAAPAPPATLALAVAAGGTPAPGIPSPAAVAAAPPFAGWLPRWLLLAALLALGLWASSPEVFLRAALAGELLLALLLLLLDLHRATGRRAWLAAAVALFLLWANLHSGVLFGLLLLALYACEPLALPVWRRLLRRPASVPGGDGGDRRQALPPAPAPHDEAPESAAAHGPARLPSAVVPHSDTLSSAAAARRQALPATAAPRLWALLAAAALTLVNPNGAAAPLYPLLLARILYASGIPWELGHFTPGAPAGATAGAPLWLLLVLLLLALLPLRQARRLRPAEAASVAVFSLLSLLSHRFVFDLVVIGLPVLYKLLVLAPPPASESLAPPAPAAETMSTVTAADASAAAAGAGAPSGGAPPAPRPGPAGPAGLAGRPALAAALAALLLLPVAPGTIAGAAAAWARRPPAAGGLIAEMFPEAALRFVAAQGIAGPGDRLFNHQNYGGFIGWRLGVPVFWDGRNDVFAELVREVATTPFADTARRYGCDWLLIAEHDLPGIAPEAAAGRWGLVYWDDFCAVYLRRGARYAAQLQRGELRLFPPFGGRPGLKALAADPRLAAAARAELARVLQANPANQRALYFAGVISLYRGELGRAAAELAAAARIRPADQVDEALAQVRRIAAGLEHLTGGAGSAAAAVRPR
jgi:hypothetical protein